MHMTYSLLYNYLSWRCGNAIKLRNFPSESSCRGFTTGAQ